MLETATSLSASAPITVIHPGHPAAPSKAAAPAAKTALLAGDSANLQGSKRTASSLLGQAPVAEDNEATTKFHETNAAAYENIEKKKTAGSIIDDVKMIAVKGIQAGEISGKAAEQRALLWKVPLTLASGAMIGILLAWYIASKDDKAMKQLRDQLAAAQTE